MELNFLVVIPVFDNAGSIAAVVSGALQANHYPILVVDDGSQIPVATMMEANPRVFHLREESNQGKGHALKKAFVWAVEHRFTHVVALDGDGQHRPVDIQLLTAAAEIEPWALIIGRRNLTQSTVPGITKFGRAFSNFWVKVETRTPVADSQSGFRLYPLFHVQCLPLRCRRYDFEIEILIRLMWKGVAIREVPIEVIYPPPGERISHFNKFSDNARISLLNAILVTVSLLRLPQGSQQLALAVGVGVFIGCLPFYGIHALLAVPAALFLRLNYLVVFLGTQISLPYVAPFLALASIRIGSPFSQSIFSSWLIGSVILGGALGCGLGSLTFFMHRRFAKKQKLWTGKSRGGYFGNWIIRTVTQKLGLRAGYFCLCFVVPYFVVFAPKARRASLQYWRVIKPEVGPTGRLFLVFRHFYRFGQVLLDRLYQSYRQEPIFLADGNGTEHISQPMKEKRAVLIAGAHAGGWDIAARYLEWHGAEGQFHPVQMQAQGVTFEKNLNAGEAAKVEKLIVNQSAMPILEIYSKLSQGKPVGLMADRPLTRHLELVSFMGKLAPFDTTPFRIASATKTPLVMSLAFKADGRNYDFYALPAKTYEYDSTRPRGEQLRDWAQEFGSFLEGHLRQHPTQWFNFFEFWSAVPESGTSPATPQSTN